MYNVFLTLIFAVVMAAGQIVLSMAAKDIFSGGSTLSVGALLSSGWLWLGVAMYGCALLFWVYILSRFDVRYAYPLSSTAILFSAMFQSAIEKNFPSGTYWLGLLLVMTGLFFISESARS